MKKALFPLLALIALAATSCQKEVDYVDLGGNNNPNPNPGTGNPSGNSIIGDWKFKKMIVDIQTYTEGAINGVTQKTTVDLDFTSTGEAGTLKIDATTMTATGIAYSANSTALMSIYVNGALLSQTPTPYQIEQPPSDGSSTYTKVTNDSLVAQSPLINVDYPGLPGTDIPQGLKISWLGDTLVLTSRVNQELIDNSLGIPVKTGVKGTQLVKLTKN